MEKGFEGGGGVEQSISEGDLVDSMKISELLVFRR